MEDEDIDDEIGNDVVVGTIYFNQWQWYLSPKEYWLMDLIKLYDIYLPTYEPYIRVEERFDIAVLDQQSAPLFFAQMKNYRVDKLILSQMLITQIPFEDEDEIMDFCPTFLVDFDKQTFKSLYNEPMQFEDYVPQSWLGTHENFLDAIPSEQSYWVVNSYDYFAQFFAT